MSEVILHISAGQGPEECRWVVSQLASAFAREAAGLGLVCDLIDEVEAEVVVAASPASLLLRIEGDGAENFAAARTGTILWTGTSPFRPHHKRRNWFVGTARVPPLTDIAELHDSDIIWQTTRASGPGGQHVNTTNSAVRATHRPTGLVATSQDQRSQHANRKLARLRLALLVAEREEASAQTARKAAWNRNHTIERGRPVRTYAGEGFGLKG